MKSTTPHAAKKVFQHSKRTIYLLILTLLLFASFLFLNQYAEAQQLVCPARLIEKIADGTPGGVGDVSINADGTRIAFLSKANINGGNPDANFEIYLIRYDNKGNHSDNGLDGTWNW